MSSGPNRGRVVGVGVAGEVGPAQNTAFNSDFGLQDVYSLGSAERAEIVIGAVRHRVNIDYLRLSQADAGFDPRDIVQNNTDLVIEIIDKKDGKVLESFRGCVLATRGVTIPTNRLMSQSIAFEAISAEGMAVD